MLFYYPKDFTCMSTKPAYLTATLAKGLDILEALAELDEIGLSDLARRLKVNGPTLFRILATLVAKGYVQKDAGTSRYRLTLKTWELGAKAVARIALRDRARPYLERLAAETGETVHLSLLQGNGIVIIDKVDSRQPVRVDTFVGQRAPAHCSATGKAILAFDPEALRAVLTSGLAQFTSTTITERRALDRELAEVRKVGWASNREEWRPGVCAVAVPIRNTTGTGAAALSITVPTARFAARAVRLRLVPALRSVGAALTRELERGRI
jgi:IclR family transcriptional regulator, KDG regulon repressor